MPTMKREADGNMTDQEKAWTAGRLFVNDAQRDRFLAFRSGGRIGLIDILKQQSERLFPNQPTPMSTHATNTSGKVDTAILAVLRESSDKHIEAMIMDPTPRGTSTDDEDKLPTLVELRYKGPFDRPGIYGICIRGEFGDPMSLADVMQIFEDLAAYHAKLMLDSDRNIMIRPRQTFAEAQKFQKIDEEVGGCHYVETSLLKDATRRYCVTQEDMTEYQEVSQKWREISANISAHFSGAEASRTNLSTPLFMDIGASTSVKASAQQHADGETTRLFGLVSAVAKALHDDDDKFQVLTYLLAPLPDAELVPMAVHVFALLVGAYHGHGGVKKYEPGEFAKMQGMTSSSERPGRLASPGYYTAGNNNHEAYLRPPESHEVQVKVEQDTIITTAYPEMHEKATAIMKRLNLKRKSLSEQEEALAAAKKELRRWEKRMVEIEKLVEGETNAIENRRKKLKLTAEKISQMSKMARVPDEDIVEVEEE